MSLHVELLQHTGEPEKIISAAAKLCYSSAGVSDILNGLDQAGIQRFLKMLMEMGHESPIEHVSFTFGIEGVSRALLAQITRHRIASYSVKSQRYVKEGQFEFITPPAIAADEAAHSLYQQSMEMAQQTYNQLADILFEKYYAENIKEGLDEKKARNQAEKKAIEDARFVLPNACETKMIVTMNARSLMNFFHHRCCSRAQWEIQALANEMLRLVQEVAPTLFAHAGPSCVAGPCPEGKMSCGRATAMRKQYKKENEDG
ncbi:MAG: FAD-dependent thymidylate synthase [Ruminococcaceae bacterium]|nr:FAD-dependent thymidylate synthase [Oscillospiraceae bacterium]